MTEFEPVSEYAETREGRPLAYLPASALPPACDLLSDSDIIKLEITGSFIQDPKSKGRLLEIVKTELIR